MANDAALTQLHPAVITTINNNNITYTATSGIANMFVADIFECGPDNKVQFIGSPNEFLAKYGKPNYKKYGQSAYNVLNWLSNGGSSYILRLLPDNAGYAHVMLNIQTRVDKPDSTTDLTSGGKIVKKNDGTKVAVKNVYIRPIVTNIQLNNTSEDLIQNELTLNRTDLTVDGYLNNFILAVYPKGRGDYYNKFGIRLTLNKTYDLIESNNTRVYNFEVVEYDENNNISIAEGPFYVSFDPESTSDYSESLYIEDVVNKYSELVNIKFNLTNYLKVATLVNENVNPFTIDLLTGQTRNYDNSIETFYCSETERDEDIHFYLQRYNIDGEAITINEENILNIPSATDEITNQIIKLDNNVRSSDYNLNLDVLNIMKQYYVSICTDQIKNVMDALYKKDNENSKILKEWKQINPSQTDLTPFVNEAGESLFNIFRTNALNYYIAKMYYNEDTEAILENKYIQLKSSASRVISEGINEFLEDVKKVQALYTLSSNENEEVTGDFVTMLNMLKSIREQLNEIDKIDILISSNRTKLLDISSTITNYALGQSTDTPINDMEYVSSLLSEQLTSVVYEILNVVYTDAELTSDKIVTDLKASILELYQGNLSLVDPDSNAQIILRKGIIESLDLMKIGYIANTVNNRQIFYGMCNSIVSKLDDLLVLCAAKNTMDNIVLMTPVIEKDEHNMDVVNAINVHTETGILGTVNNVITLLENIVNTAVNMQTSIVEEEIKDIIIRANNNINAMEASVVVRTSKVFNNYLQDFNYPLKFSNGSDGDFTYNDKSTNTTRNALIKNMMIKAYKGNIDESILNRDVVEFRHVFDANYNVDIKHAILSLCKDLRGDAFFWADSGFTVSPEDCLNWRRNNFDISSYFSAIYSQDMIYYDEYTGKNIKLTPTYYLSGQIPYVARQYGLQFPIAGPRRGVITGFKSISWVPNDSYKERLYIKRINYIEQDSRRTKLGSQLTSDYTTSALSDINHVLILLDIKYNTEKLVADYQFELSDTETINALNYALNEYLSIYVSNRSCESIDSKVYASDYDKKRKLLRVELDIKFIGVIERISLNLNIKA